MTEPAILGPVQEAGMLGTGSKVVVLLAVLLLLLLSMPLGVCLPAPPRSVIRGACGAGRVGHALLLCSCLRSSAWPI